MAKNFSQFHQELNDSQEITQSRTIGLDLVNNLRESKISDLDSEESLSELLETWISMDLSRILNEEDPLGELGTDQEPDNSGDIISKIDDEIEESQEEDKKELLVNLKEFIPTLKKFSGTNYKKVLVVLYGFITKEKDEKNITPLDKQYMADIAFDLLTIIIKNKSLTSIIGTEAKVSLNSSYDPLLEEVMIEAKKAKKKSEPKKKVPEDKVTPKLQMLLRLGLVDKPLYTRAQRALSSKKVSGSIPQYRNILFDILDKIVHYIEKDPTLYNRMRVNVMKEMKNSLPKKQMVNDAYLAGKEAKKNGIEEIPEEFESEYFLKSAWLRGNNEKVELEETPAEIGKATKDPLMSLIGKMVGKLFSGATGATR